MGNSESDKVLKGKEGFLFLCNDSNDVIGQITGKRPLTSEGLAAWKNALEQRQEHARKHGYIYRFVIAPNKHCVYSQYLPEGIQLSDNRPAVPLVNAIGDPVIYPLELFKSIGERLCYYKTDTHWNGYGALTFMNSLAAEIGSRPLSWKDGEKIKSNGDLGSRLVPPASESFIGALPSAKVNYHVDNRKIYAFIFPFYDFEIIERLRPDVVASESAERFFPNQPAEAPLSSSIARGHTLAWKTGAA